MANNEGEIWKALQGVPGIEVSTFGRVRTLDKMVWNGWGDYPIKGRILKQYDNVANGYSQVHVTVYGKPTVKYVHRLVAQAFIPNPDNLPQVNHKNCIRDDNRVENLEFCTASYNRRYQEKFGISSTEARGHPLFAINLKTFEVSQFQSQHEAGQALGVDQGNINNVIKGRLKQTNGYWFVNDDGHAVDVVKSKLHDVGGIGLKIYN